MTRVQPLAVRAALVAMAAAALLAIPQSASAAGDRCQIRDAAPTPTQGPALFDSQGYFFDTLGAQAPPDRNNPYATLHDSGSHDSAGTPPGPVANDDTYDDWGGLFVGGDALANLYTDSDPLGCTLEADNQQLAFAHVNIGGLVVQRKLFVSSSGLPGARLVEFVTNPGSEPVTTSVQLGDTKAGNHEDDLGSDDTTTVLASSSGSTSLSPADLWGVTGDASSGALDDNLLAHVFDGSGGADRIDSITFTGVDPSNPEDNLTYGWNNVTIAPGQTAAFLSWEIQHGSAALTVDSDLPGTVAAANALEGAPLEQIYAGLTDAEIFAVRNWPKPAPAAVVDVAAIANAADNLPLRFSASKSSSSSAPGICAGRSVAWDFGDGSKATGETASHKFKAGNYDVTLTITNSCGAVSAAKQHIHVADKTKPVASASLAKSTTLAKLLGGKVKEGVKSNESGTAAIAGTVPASVANKAGAAKISKTVLKTNVKLTAGKRGTVKLKLTKKAAKALKALGASSKRKSFILTVTTTVRDAAGNKTTLKKKRLKVRF